MFHILNRISRIISFLVGFFIAWPFFGVEHDFRLIFWFIIFALIFKGVLLSENFLKIHLEIKNEEEEEREKETKAYNEDLVYTEEEYNNNYIKEETEPEKTPEIPLLNINTNEMDTKIINETNNNNTEPDKISESQLSNTTKEEDNTNQNEIKDDNIITKNINEESKIKKFLREFFAEKLMAKVGGILLVLGIIFFIGLLYNTVGPVAKIVIGFLAGCTIYGIGVLLNKKGFIQEGMILLGVGILINYVVILGGRWLFTDASALSNWLTFLFLVLNTAFSIFTSYIYSSKNLLLFSIFFAYFIPFLVGSEGNNYSFIVLIGYSIIVSIGALIISYQGFKINDVITAKILLYFVIILGNLLILFAPVKAEVELITQIIGFNIITFSTIFLAYKQKLFSDIIILFIIGFGVLFFILGSGITILSDSFNSFAIFISYLISIIGFIFFILAFIIAGVTGPFIFFIFVPLFLIIALLGKGSLFLGTYLIPFILIFYLLIFGLKLEKIVGNGFKMLFFVMLGGFIIFSNLIDLNFNIDLLSNIQGNHNNPLNFNQFITIIITAFIFLFSSYFLASKKGLAELYAIGTGITILLLSPLIVIKGGLYDNKVIISIVSLILFGILNFALPFLNKNIFSSGIKNFVLGVSLGIIYLSVNLYFYGTEYFPGNFLGIAFMLLAIPYALGGDRIYNKYLHKENSLLEMKNFVYIYISIAISLFSVGVAFMFGNTPLIITLIWLLEATLLIALAGKTGDNKIFIAGNILLLIGIYKLYSVYFTIFLFESIGNEVFNIASLIIITIIALLFILSLFFINKYKIIKGNFTKALIIIGLFAHFLLLWKMFNIPTKYNEIFGLTYISILLIIFKIIKDKIFTNFSTGLIGLVLFINFISTFSIIISIIDKITWINYLFVGILLFVLGINYCIERYRKEETNNFLYKTSYTYLFFILPLCLYNITNNNTFVVTIYFAILAFTHIHIGILIKKNAQMIRSIGLFILILVLLKILFLDLYSANNNILRVIMLIIVGSIMIYISTLYSKNKLSMKDDFNFDFFDIIDDGEGEITGESETTALKKTPTESREEEIPANSKETPTESGEGETTAFKKTPTKSGKGNKEND